MSSEAEWWAATVTSRITMRKLGLTTETAVSREEWFQEKVGDANGGVTGDVLTVSRNVIERQPSGE